MILLICPSIYCQGSVVVSCFYSATKILFPCPLYVLYVYDIMLVCMYVFCWKQQFFSRCPEVSTRWPCYVPLHRIIVPAVRTYNIT
jgi:hypothetical protein